MQRILEAKARSWLTQSRLVSLDSSNSVVGSFGFRRCRYRVGWWPRWRDPARLGLAVVALVQALATAGKLVIAVLFGNPYLLSTFPSVPAYLLSWGGVDVGQEEAAGALLGENPIAGRLSISLAPYHRRGEGIRRPAAE